MLPRLVSKSWTSWSRYCGRAAGLFFQNQQVVQDWGGILGLCLPQFLPGRFKRFVVMDTALPLGLPLNQGFLDWKECATKTMEGNFKPSQGMTYMMRESLETLNEPGVKEAYDAPYPSWEYTAGWLP